ncbi:hypothetical protein RM531_13655 [Salinisphaera sp. P385]|uniref:EF-hand domain-containing protein n=1 Tax=Spectribacter acetivorans TaxID=3075603 RepID=A0ABU3BAN5_9GAMM|nr:hypothetical protein [Salinisphaera sp. P385]MDT0619519.1 hypothetical protein [Salinisphaera sp. P385]
MSIKYTLLTAAILLPTLGTAHAQNESPLVDIQLADADTPLRVALAGQPLLGAGMTATPLANPASAGGSGIGDLLGGIPLVGALLAPEPPSAMPATPADTAFAVGDLDGDGRREDQGTRFGDFLVQVDPDDINDQALSFSDYVDDPQPLDDLSTPQ